MNERELRSVLFLGIKMAIIGGFDKQTAKKVRTLGLRIFAWWNTCGRGFLPHPDIV
jgi:hypothetical protein